jgi:hypothetical protein
MDTSEVITLNQWDALSKRVGGKLLKDPHKLESMRKIDRT